jgi:hypothetical protein
LAQGDLFEDELGDKSGIDLYEDGLEDAMLGKMDSDLFDDGMLSSFVKLGEAFRWGVERIEVLNGRTVNLTPENFRHLRELTSRTPRPQHVRVAGKLEGLRHTKRRFLVQLTDGSTVAGLAEKMPVDELAQLFGRNVVVEGTAHFRPSGRVQRIEATRLAPALDVDLKLFALQPRSLVTESSVALREAVPHSGEHWLDHIWGKWPGDESDAEVVQLIKEFS